jgi:heat shock protein HslJ
VKRPWRLALVAGLAVCVLPLAGLLAGCGDDQEDLALVGTKWVMTTYAVTGAMKDALPTPTVDATFAAPKDGEGDVSGSGGINQYSGRYTVDGDKLTVGTISSTRKAGAPAVMQQETDYLIALQTAATYQIDGDTLTIRSASGVTVLTYVAATT